MRRLLFLILVVPLLGCGAARQPRYTLRQFLAVHRSNTPTLSPRADQIGYLTNATGEWQAWIASASGDASRQLTRFPGGVAALAWSPSGDDLLVAADRGGNQQYQLYLASSDGSAVRPLTDSPTVKHDVGGWSRDGRYVFYASNARDRRFFDCYLLDVQTKETRRVLERDAVLQAAALSLDGRLLAAVERTSEVDQNVYIADVATGRGRLVTAHEGKARFRVIGFSADAASLWVVSDLGRELLSLAAIDVASGKLRFVEEAEAPHDTDVAVLARNGRRLAVSRNDDGYEKLSVLDAGTLAPVALPELPRGVVTPAEFSADGRFLSIVITTPTHDDDVYLVDLERRTLRRVTHSDQAGIDESKLVTPTLVHYPAKDGRTIPAFLYLPRHPGAARLPVIVSIHGGPEEQELPWFWATYQFFLSRGYAVLAPNIRGSSGYGKQYLTLDDGPRRWDALGDVEAGVDWLRARPDVDPRRIVAFGASYGGFVVLAMLAHHPGLFAAGIDFYGPSDLASFLGRTAEYRRGQRAAEYGDPARDARFFDEISPAKHADRIADPLFIAQGANDPIVPPAESQQLVDTLRARGRKVHYLVLPDEGHGFAKEVDLITAYEAVVGFLESLRAGR